MEKKILFLDLDGTLLNDAKEITDGNRRALEAALAQGHRVVVATGRPLISAMEQNKRLGLTWPGCYIIAYNGGAVYDVYNGEVIFRKTLPRASALKAIDLANRHGIHIQTYDDTHVLVEPHCDKEEIRQYCGVIGMEYRVVEDHHKTLTWDPPKALAISLRGQSAMEALQAEMRQTLGQELDCFFSSKFYMEIVPKDMNKGNAVRSLCKQLGIDIAQSIAIGDEANDISMIQAAGLGVCMANGIDALKAVAGYVTIRDNNHDGVAEVVEKFMLTE